MGQETTPFDDPVRDNWYRYQYMRDSLHQDFVDKARRCEEYVAGLQWDPADLQTLKQSGRPAMTINKILPAVDHLTGEQLFNRADIAFRPARGGANAEVADALTKTHMNIAQSNRLSWVRTDVFADGLVTGRGFFDVRIDIDSNFMGDIRVKKAPSEMVMLDPDAQEYDPASWSDVGRSYWTGLNDMKMLYGPEIAKELEQVPSGYSPYTFTDDDFVRDGTFSAPTGNNRTLTQAYLPYGVQKFFRVFERQHFVVTNGRVFVDMTHGEIVPVPETWDHNRLSDFLQNNRDVHVMQKQIKKIRWTATAGPVTVHDAWSPYRYFTIVPFFPHYRNGRTHGVVEHLLSPQDIFNKSRSQELHVVNTTANSGYIVQDNNLVNMTERQLENVGAQTGLVIVVKDVSQIDKIKPNQVPTGLDRVSFKAEDDLKNIAQISDSETGFTREDVSGRAIRANQAAGSTSFAPLFDNLARTDNLLAHRILNLIQTFYTEPRLIHVIGTKPGQQDQSIVVNEVTTEGKILNDLSLGEYEVIVTSEPDRDSFEESQFDHAVEMRKDLGIEIPDEFIIRVSKLRDKEELLQAMNPADPEQEEFDKQLANQTAVAELEKLRAEGADKKADALLKSVRAASEKINIDQGQSGGLSPELAGEAKIKAFATNQEHQNERDMENLKFMNQLSLMHEQHVLDKQLEQNKPKTSPAT